MIEPGASEPTDPTRPDAGTTAQGADDMATTEVQGASDGPAPGDEGGVGGLAEGTRVEVRNRLDGTWSRGFEIVGPIDGGYRIRRLSDGTQLPVTFTAGDVRVERERRRGTWWF
jgi:hypothetical protein